MFEIAPTEYRMEIIQEMPADKFMGDDAIKQAQ